MLLDVLPELTSKLYRACVEGSVSDHVTPALRAAAERELAKAMACDQTAELKLGSMHVCASTR